MDNDRDFAEVCGCSFCRAYLARQEGTEMVAVADVPEPEMVFRPSTSELQAEIERQRPRIRAERIETPKMPDPLKMFLISDLSKLVGQVSKIAARSSFREAPNEMKKLYNIQKLGNGMFATAYDIVGSDYVVKIASKIDGSFFWLQRSALEAFGNPFMPRVLTAQALKGGGYIAVMEKLTKIQDLPRAKERLAEDQADDLQHFITCEGNVIETDWYKPSRFELGLASNPKIANGLLYITKLSEERGECIDLHYGNFMMRGDQIVITDPLC